jgi:hypothetical protein
MNIMLFFIPKTSFFSEFDYQAGELIRQANLRMHVWSPGPASCTFIVQKYNFMNWPLVGKERNEKEHLWSIFVYTWLVHVKTRDQYIHLELSWRWCWPSCGCLINNMYLPQQPNGVKAAFYCSLFDYFPDHFFLRKIRVSSAGLPWYAIQNYFSFPYQHHERKLISSSHTGKLKLY